jgi:predicted Na+-dependent transporter
MASKAVSVLERIARKIAYTSLLVIVALAIVTHLTSGQTYSLATVILVVFIALGNIGYLYSRSKKLEN